MTIDELVIQIRATASGVKEGIDAATKELRRLDTERNRLRQDLEIKIKVAGIEQLTQQLKDLEEKKKALQTEVNLYVKTDRVKEAEQELANIERQKKELNEIIKFTVDPGKIDEAKQKMLELIQKQRESENELKLAVDESGLTDAKNKLSAIDEEMAKIKKEINLKMNSEDIREAVDNLRRVGEEADNAAQAIHETESALKPLGITATGVFVGMVAAIKTGIDSFNEYSAAMNGLASQMDYIGVSVADAMDVVSQKTADGLISPTDVALSVKNLTTYGYTLEQASKMVDRLKESATYGRQAQYSLGEAVRVTTEGIKNENSVLSDAAGVTKNISKMYEEYAAVLGKSKDDLTQQEKVQAVFNGVMVETEATVGNVEKYINELAGSQAKLGAVTAETGRIFGESLAPSLQLATDGATLLLGGLNSALDATKPLTAGLTTVITVGSGLVAIFTLIKTAAIQAAAGTGILNTALGILHTSTGGVLLAITAAAGAIASIVTVIGGYEEEQKKLNEELERTKELLGEGANDSNITQYEEKAEAAEELRETIESLNNELIRQQQEYERLEELSRAGTDVYSELEHAQNTLSQSTSEFEGKLSSLGEKLASIGVSLKDANGNFKTHEQLTKDVIEAEKQWVSEIENRKQKTKEAEDAALVSTETLRKKAKEIDKLKDAYKALDNGEKLSADNMLELIDLYPEIAFHIKDNINWQDTLKDKLLEVADTEKNVTKERKQGEIDTTTTALTQAKSRLEIFRNEIRAKIAMISPLAAAMTEIGMSVEVLELEKKLNKAIADLEAIELTTSLGSDGGGSKGGRGGGRGTKEKKDLIKEEYELERKGFEERKKLSEMTTQDEIAELEKLRQKYASHAEIIKDIDIEMYSLRKQLNDEWYKQSKETILKLDTGRDATTDYMGMLIKLDDFKQKVKETYKDYPETVKNLLQELDEEIIRITEKRSDKILALESKSIDDRIKEQERYIQIQKNLSGITYNDSSGQEQTVKYTAKQEIQDTNKIIAINEERISKLQSLEQALTDKESDELEARLQQRVAYQQKIEDLSISSVKEIQSEQKRDAEKAKKDLEKDVKDKVDIAKKGNKAILADIKDRYAEEIKAAEEAASAELKAINDKINAIDALMKQQQRDEQDNETEDKIKRLKKQLEFEADGTNIYELKKQIASEQAEYDKRKRKEGLEDEKSSLKQQADAIKEALKQQKEELQKARDDEVKLLEQGLEDFIASQEARLESKTKIAKTETQITKAELDKQQSATKKFLQDEYKNQNQAQKEKRQLLQTSTSNIISDLFSRLSEFAEAGRRAGQAYASAFAEAADNMAYSIGTAAYTNTPSSYSNNISVYNTFNEPVNSPYKVSREIEDTMRAAARSI